MHGMTCALVDVFELRSRQRRSRETAAGNKFTMRVCSLNCTTSSSLGVCGSSWEPARMMAAGKSDTTLGMVLVGNSSVRCRNCTSCSSHGRQAVVRNAWAVVRNTSAAVRNMWAAGNVEQEARNTLEGAARSMSVAARSGLVASSNAGVVACNTRRKTTLPFGNLFAVDLGLRIISLREYSTPQHRCFKLPASPS